jgi:uncharacterized protein involved in exopolysaccharide biosynthesis
MDQPTASAPERDGFDLGPFLAKLGAHKRLAAGLSIGLALVGLTLAKLLPQVWLVSSHLLVTATREDRTGFEQLNPNSPTPLTILEGLAQSATVMEEVSRETKVGRSDLARWLKAESESKTAQLVLSMEINDPALSLRVIQAWQDALLKRAAETRANASGMLASVLKSRLEKQSQSLKNLDQQIVAFTKAMKAPSTSASLGGQAEYVSRLRELELKQGAAARRLKTLKESAKLAAGSALTSPTNLPDSESFRSQLLAKELELRRRKVELGDQAPEIIRLNEEYESLKKEAEKAVNREVSSILKGEHPSVATLESEYTVLTWQVEAARALAEEGPQEAKVLRELQRELAAQEDVYRSLRTQYEEALVKEDVGIIQISVLDPPAKAVEPSNRRFITYPLAGLLGGFALACFWIFIIRKGK